jgi:hypothetical protein
MLTLSVMVPTDTIMAHMRPMIKRWVHSTSFPPVGPYLLDEAVRIEQEFESWKPDLTCVVVWGSGERSCGRCLPARSA